MKILHVYKDYAPVLGGMENHIRLVAERQAADGHQVTVLVTSPNHHTTRETMNGVTVIKAGRLATLASTPLSLALCLEISRSEPDITHLHFPYPVGEVAQWLFGRGPTVITYQSDVVRQKRILALYRPLMMHILRRAKHILVSSPAYIETSPILSQMRERCSVVPLSIDASRFREPHAEAERLRQSWRGQPTVLFVGVLRYYKGLDYLIPALRELDAQLVIVGRGPMEQELKTLTTDLGLQDKVTFAGAIDDELLPAYYQAADVFCLPASARSEAFGLVQLEALAAGLPIVSTELGTGVSYVNKDGASGLVVPPRDSVALAGALQLLLEDDALRSRLAAGAARRSDQFSVDIMMRRIYDVYDQALVQDEQ